MHIKPILLAVLVLGVVGGVGYTVMNNRNDNKSESSQTSGSVQAGEESSEKTTIKSLLTQNKDVQCTFSGDVDGNSYSGTAYITGKRMLVDYTGTTNGETQSGHLLAANDFTYIWGDDDSTEGFKIPVTAEDEDVESLANSIDQDTEYDFDCSAWSVDEGKLTPPDNVTFTDLASLLQSQAQY